MPETRRSCGDTRGVPAAMFVPESSRILASDQRRTSASRSRGSARTSAMTVIGRGTAKPSIHSTAPSGAKPSAKRLASARMAGSSAAMRRTLKAGLRSWRWRVCSGGSAIARASACVGPAARTSSTCGTPDWLAISTATSFDEKTSGRRATRHTSSWRVTTTMSSPGSSCTGPSWRRRSQKACGSAMTSGPNRSAARGIVIGGTVEPYDCQRPTGSLAIRNWQTGPSARPTRRG